MNQMSTEMNQNDKKEWRRSKVRELLVKRYNHYEIANTLQIPRPTITKDIQYLRQQDRENLRFLLALFLSRWLALNLKTSFERFKYVWSFFGFFLLFLNGDLLSFG